MDKQIEEYVNELPAIDANIALNGKLELNNRDCYIQLVDTFNHKCYALSQADVYHAYQVVRKHGIPDENIVVMHYDDIAYHKQNPTPGVVINRVNGTDVYKTPNEVPKHYTGDEVTPENFLGALKGDVELEKQGKKVIKSGPNDRIFVYLEDHGAEEVVLFPHDVLHSLELNAVLKKMHMDNKFSQLVFYLNACEAGSMFEKLLPGDINVYAVTATKPGETGWYAEKEWGTYKTWLATYFTIVWLDDCEISDLTKELLSTQYEYIKEHNNLTMEGELVFQHAQQYGDLSIAAKQHVSDYLDDAEQISRYVTELEGLLSRRKLMDKQIEEYVNELPAIDANIALNGKLELNNRDCYQKLVDTFNQKCYTLSQNTYALNKLKIFVNICEQMRDSSDADIAVNRLIQHCNRNAKPIERIV
ncbi:unnamed protein product [Oppiella nova]|uniref:Legumain prodomain domain-containing protein n=1 Tax=Oppiella nova TaxID=334625 RepID=A0A7R9M2G3_9ACAR|nr:unnamed protein product [Oppiella nova]CAG2169480.1 unnamed protein product [Oppiella nova]